MKKLFLLVFLASYTVVFSQETPKVILKDSSTLKLASLKVDVNIIGNTATTTYDMQFYNELDRTLEGELTFPLAEGQFVSNFSMNVNGVLRDAVIVEKELARVAFENTVRQNIDPGLLEKTQGNNYKARVYPILPKDYKRVVITYEEVLQTSNNLKSYQLPLDTKNPLESFSIEIKVHGNTKPTVGSSAYRELTFDSMGNSYTTTVNKNNYVPKESLILKIPVAKDSDGIATYSDYFYTYKALTPKSRVKEKPKHITLLWDASYSMRYRKIEKEISILKEYLKYIQYVKVQFIAFNNDIYKNKTIQIVNGNIEALENEIRSITYDGGTSLDLSNIVSKNTDEILVFTDGMSNLGLFKNANNHPIYAINAIVSSNHELLKKITSESGGNYLNLMRLSDKEALEILKHETFQFLGVKPNKAIHEVYPNKNTNVINDFSIAGKFTTNTTIELQFGFHGKVTETIKVPVNRSNVNKLVKRLWAKKKLTDLSENKGENKNVIIQLAKQYHLITDYTSMLILDRIEDYVRYKIEPPSELKTQYKELLQESEEDKAEEINDLKERKEDMFEAYEEIIDWYKKRFPKKQKKNKKISTETSNQQDQNIATTETEVEEEPMQPTPVNRPVPVREPVEPKIALDSTKNIISGVVLDNNNEPLPGASVIVKGTTNGTSTDFDGKFSLNAEPNDELVIAFVGFNTKELLVGNSSQLNITIQESQNHLNEVVVVGYGTKSRSSNISASVSSVISNSLAGKATGVNITGQNGATSSVTVRGVSSMNTNSQPLYIVDGVISSKNPIIELKSEDINSIQVLKAISATTLYGARGADGVILITTKKGLEQNEKIIQEFNAQVNSKIELQPWNPNEPYIEILKKQKTVKGAYLKYLEIRDDYSNSPSFYLDVADFFDQKGNQQIALTILSNLAEIELDNYELMKALAYKLEYFNQHEMAFIIYKKILELRPEEPQSYRDIALAYEQVGQIQKSFELLYSMYNGELLEKDEEELYYGIEYVAFIELCRLVNKYPKQLKLKRSIKRKFKNMPVDMRVVIDWNHKDTDIDLWVIDPNKEKAYYRNSETRIGGHMSEDLMDGFGPEEFMLKDAISGKYEILVDYFSDDVQKISGPTIMKVTIYRNYGKVNESKKITILRLDKEEDELEVGTIKF